MPKPEKNAMALVDACRTPIRRKIMILAQEADAQQLRVTSTSLAEALGTSLGSTSYHVTQLVKAGALKEDGGVQKRGAWQRHLVPSKAFQATMTDTVALDQLAEHIEEFPKSIASSRIAEIIRATGRPVEA